MNPEHESVDTTYTASARDVWHAQRIEALRREDGWLTLVGLDFLEPGRQSVGADPSADLRYAGCGDPIVGTYLLEGTVVRFARAAAPDDWTSITPDLPGEASVVRSGSVSFTLVERNRRLALRVRDSRSPVRTDFDGIALFPFDPSRVVRARVVAAEAGERIAVTNVTGFTEDQAVAARLLFDLDGQSYELIASGAPEGRLFLVFGDATNGTESYGGGRFLEVEAPRDGFATIDFNRSYNPPCSFTAFATCPLPTASNMLPVPLRAGERAVGKSSGH